MGLKVEELHIPKSDSLRAMYWRSEILQVMYWVRGEGFGEVVDPELIERFLGIDASVGLTYLDRLVDEGYLTRVDGGFKLSEHGVEEGGREFAAAFADLTRPAHGECSADCWCHVSIEEAEACAEERAGHAHS